MLTNIWEVFMFTLQEVHRREQEIVEKNQNLVEMKRKNQTVSSILITNCKLLSSHNKCGKK